MSNQMLQKLIGVFMLCLLPLGCAHIVAPEAPIQKPPLVQAIPLTVGVYYPEELQKYECETGKGYIFDKYVVRLGPASMKLYDLVFSGLFAKSFRVNNYNTSAPGDQKVDVVELMITNFTGCEARWPIIGRTYVSITYKAILRAASGEIIAEWVGTGHATPSEVGNRNQTEGKYLENLTAIAMRKTAADFVKNFQENPDINAWLESRGVSQGIR
jgi:hypothetical protein